MLRAEADFGAIVLHVSPSWRTRTELEWTHAVVRHAHVQVPQAVAPIERRGRTVFEWGSRLVAMFPFIDGEVLDRDNPVLRMDAARILAAVHKSLLDWPAGPRPGSDDRRPVPPAAPEDFRDPALDAWWLSVRGQGFTIAPTHGDYYRRNLICANSQIVGVIDWHDAVVRPLAVELAAATFELCKNDEHVLQLDHADRFVAAYRAAGGPVHDHEIKMLLPLVRLWIRNDARLSLAYDGDLGSDYVAKQIRAFRDLARCNWMPGHSAK